MLAYEIYATSFTPTPVTVRELRVMGDGRELATFSTQELEQMVRRPRAAETPDRLIVDAEGKSFSGDGTKNEDFYCHGADAVAVASGVVVATNDGIPENDPTRPETPVVPIDLETVGGNYVALDPGDGCYAMHAHLMPGSLRVQQGVHVSAGQVLGKTVAHRHHRHPVCGDSLWPRGLAGAARGTVSHVAPAARHRLRRRWVDPHRMTVSPPLHSSCSTRSLMRTLVAPRLLLLLLSAGFATPSLGQGAVRAPTGPAAPAPEVPPPALLVREAGSKQVPLALTRVETRVLIRGTLAETTTTLTFHNELPRVLEGELVFPLPEGSTVSGYAIDLQGVLVDAAVVEKDEARIVFEQEVRKGVDPGLVEWTRGNNFRTRIYPIPARGDRTVRVSYVSELGLAQGQKGGFVARYILPLRYPQPVPVFKVLLDYVSRDGAAQPEVTGGGRQLGGFRLVKEGNRSTLQLAGENIRADEDLRLTLPDLPRQSVALEQDERDGTTFLINDFPQAPQAAPQRVSPRRIALYWDASLSRGLARPETRQAELELLRGALKPLDGVAVDLLVFRDAVAAPLNFTVEKGQCPALFQALERLDYDGGTGLSFAIPRSRAGQASGGAADYGYALLFTDGLGNLGGDLPRTELPVYTVSADASANHALLRHIAQHSGGQYLNLQRLTAEQAAGRIGVPVFSLIKIEFDPSQVDEVYPRGVQAVNGAARIAGHLRAPEATLTLHYGFDAAAPPVSSVRYVLGRSAAVPAATDSPGGVGLLARAWAQKKLDELALLPEKNRDALLALGKRYNLVTPGTSLLVLETLEQHVQHHLLPAASRKELRQQYLASVAQQETESKRTREAKLEEVARMWQARVAWWERKFEYTPHKAPHPGQMMVSTPSARRPASPDAAEREAAPMLEGAAGGIVAPGEASPSASSMAGAPAPAKAKKEAGGADRDEPKPQISIKAWDPETPYLAAIKSALGDAGRPDAHLRAYAAYLAQRKEYVTSPAYYLDCAELFFRQGRDNGGNRAVAASWHGLGVRILSSIADLGIDSPPLTRVVAHKLQHEGELDLAIDQFEKVLKLRPEEPQSYRDLALALAERARSHVQQAPAAAAWADFERALNLLNEIVIKPWDSRFPEIEVIALEEANDIAAWMQRLAPKAELAGKHFQNPLDPRLRKLLDYDARIVMTWDTDLTDMDLWVTEPTGEKCDYSHNLTELGGAITRDFTQGYGPEAYAIRRAIPGKYVIQTNYYGSRQQTLTGPTTVQAEVITHFGRPDETRRPLTLRLTGTREVVDVGTIELKP